MTDHDVDTVSSGDEQPATPAAILKTKDKFNFLWARSFAHHKSSSSDFQSRTQQLRSPNEASFAFSNPSACRPGPTTCRVVRSEPSQRGRIRESTNHASPWPRCLRRNFAEKRRLTQTLTPRRLRLKRTACPALALLLQTLFSLKFRASQCWLREVEITKAEWS